MTKKVTDLGTLSTADSTDVLLTVDVSANTSKQVPVSGLTTGFSAKSIALTQVNGGTTAGVLQTDASGNVTASPLKLGYSSTTTAQTAITSEVDATSLTATVTAPGNRDLKVSGNLNIADTTAGAICSITLKEGATVLRMWNFGVYNTTNAISVPYQHVITAPSAGSHTYKLTVSFNASGQLYANAAAKSINDFLVEAI